MQVRVYSMLRELIGESRLSVPITGTQTVGDVLEALSLAYPALAVKLWDENREVKRYVTVFLNGRSIDYLQGTKTPVIESDVISLFPPVGGGCGP